MMNEIGVGKDYFLGNFYLVAHLFQPKSNSNSKSFSKTNSKPNQIRTQALAQILILTLKKINKKCANEYISFRFGLLNLKILGEIVTISGARCQKYDCCNILSKY